MNSRAVIALLALLISASARCQEGETIYLDETVISGNQELPKVLYILPWRDNPGEAVPSSAPAMDVRAIMAPIYPDEYRREMKYRELVGRSTGFDEPSKKLEED